MWNNHFKIAWRNLIRNKSFSIINIGGLSIGIGASLLLFIIVNYELSYNKFLPDSENIYQLGTVMVNESGENYTPGVPIPALDAYREGIPDIILAPLVGNVYSQVSLLDDNGIVHPDKKFVDDVFFTDPSFFEIFKLQWIAGSAEILNQPNTIVLTQKTANKYFSKWENAINQSIQINNQISVKVGGIIEDIPLNSDFPFNHIISYLTFKNNPLIFKYDYEWGSNNSDYRIFASIPSNQNKEEIKRRMNAISESHYQEINPLEKRFNYLLAMEDIHYDDRFSTYGNYRITKNTLMMLSIIGLFILLMGCINFINLSTAQAVNRSKEIGIRKVLGSDRNLIFWQLMGETSLIVLFSIFLACIWVKLVLPHIETLIGITDNLNLLSVPNIIYLLLTGISVSFLAGCYPAVVIAGFKPINALKGKQTVHKKTNLRPVLVVLQFTISQTLIIGTLIAVLQMDLIKNSDLGFNKEAIFILNSKSDSAVLARQSTFKNELLKLKEIESISFSSDPPSSQLYRATNVAFDRRPDENFHLFYKSADENYFKTYNIPIVAGRIYNDRDSLSSVIINETLVKMLNLQHPNEAIGKEIRMGGGKWLQIVGVMGDFVSNSLRDKINPLLIGPNQNFYTTVSLKLNTNNLVTTRNTILSEWNKVYPEYVVNDFWFDESIENFYQQENQLTLLYKIFSGIAILLSCLGLYGLISFSTVQKRKEVGIRKVLGASVKSILILFSKEITILIIISLFISIPIAWYISQQWLEIFSKKINMSWTIFLTAALISICIAWITIFARSFKAANGNPINSLREE